MKKSVLVLFFIFLTQLLSITKNCYSVTKEDSTKNENLLKGSHFLQKGIDLIKLGAIDSAHFYIQKSIVLFDKDKNQDFLATAYISLGIIQKINGKYNDALTNYNKAEDLLKSLNNKEYLVYVYANKANIFSSQQDHQNAELYYTESLTILNSDSIKNRLEIASIYNNLGIIYRNTNRNKKAINYFLMSLKLKNNDKTVYLNYGNLALSYEKEGSSNKADYYYLQALKSIKDYNVENTIWHAQHLVNYGLFLQNSKNNFTESIQYLKKALTIYTNTLGLRNPETSRVYNKIGEYYLKTGNYKTSLLYFQKSLIALSDEFNDTNYISNPDIKSVTSKIQFLKTIKNKSSVLLEIWKNDKSKTDYLTNSLKASELANDIIREIRSGFISEQSKLFLAENEQETYTKALEICYKLFETTQKKEYFKKAFLFSESRKSVILSESIQNNNALITGNIPIEIQNTENTLKKNIWTYEELIYEEKRKKTPNENKISFWNSEIFELKEQHTKLISQIENDYPEYFKLKYKSIYIEIDDIQKRISRNDAIIEYSFGDEFIYIFLITSDEYKLIAQKIDFEFEKNLDSQIRSLTNNNFSNHTFNDFTSFIKTSNYIYNQLILPVSSGIKGKHLIIIPEGKLAYLPFETLTSEPDTFNTIRYNKLHYFIYENSISYSYSASILFDSETRHKIAPKKLVAFAPKYENQDNREEKIISTRQQYRELLYPLKGINEEAKSVSEIIGGETYLDENAGELNFKHVACDFDILHLAMHTILNDSDPMYSKMVFSQNSDTLEDNFLNTYEVYNLQLKSRMAVLSSCNSGSGILQNGEGVMSLARGFMFAGCPSIIMTLWTVEDNSGVKLMTQFYKNLKKGFSKSKSLQQSKIEFLKQADQLHSHPYFWSGYVVIGNNDALYVSIYIYIGFSLLMSLILAILIVKRFKNSKTKKNQVSKN